MYICIIIQMVFTEVMLIELVIGVTMKVMDDSHSLNIYRLLG